MSSVDDDVFADRRKALEEEFFHKQDKKLIERLRASAGKKALREALKQSGSHIGDAVVDTLAELGVTAETVASLTLVPLVAVAWADGSLDDKERKAILDAAASMGVQAGGPGYALLQQWLSHKPGARLVCAWEAYVGALSSSLGQTDRESLKADLLGRAREVAQASGGFLGIGPKVSGSEEDMLKRLAHAFDGAARA